uniref:Transmembrane protein n=1 Tax=Cacopsylla melanoneura TaxID=428564 RepID=A0A8D9F1R6_9HEMI
MIIIIPITLSSPASERERKGHKLPRYVNLGRKTKWSKFFIPKETVSLAHSPQKLRYCKYVVMVPTYTDVKYKRILQNWLLGCILYKYPGVIELMISLGYTKKQNISIPSITIVVWLLLLVLVRLGVVCRITGESGERRKLYKFRQENRNKMFENINY